MKFDVNRYQKQLKTKNIGKKIIPFDIIDSTNNYASALEKKSETSLDGIIIISEKQTSGRGKFGKQWLSPEGGLWFTIILESVIPEQDLAKITLLTAYSLAETLKNLYDIPAIIKWPNDIYYKKLKIAGILTEVEKFKKNLYLNIGIGINANIDQKDLGKYSKKSTSIKQITGKTIRREKLLSNFLLNFEKIYGNFQKTNDFKSIFKKIEKILSY